MPDITSQALALERIKGLGRLVLAATLGLVFLLAPPRQTPLYPLAGFIIGLYFVFSAAALVFLRSFEERRWRLAALAGDVAVLVVALLLAPQLPAAFLLFFVYFALLAGLWRGWWAAGLLSVLVVLAYLTVMWPGAELAGQTSIIRIWFSTFPQHWLVVAGLLAAGALMGAVAGRERRYIERAALVGHFANQLQLAAGWPTLWKRWLGELCRRYEAGRTLLVYRNPANDRVLLWDFRRRADSEGDVEEADRPPRDLKLFLLEREAGAFVGNRLTRHQPDSYVRVRPGQETPPAELPGRFFQEFSVHSLLTVPLEGTEGKGRLFLLDSLRGGFSPEQLADLEELLRQLEPSLANLLTIRSLITRAVDDERMRIARELHDGVAQSLASVGMQLDVYRRLAAKDPPRTEQELAALHSVVKQEQEGLRRFLRTLKPVRVSAEELGRWMLAHGAQFRQETGIEVEVIADPLSSSLPEGVCREVFQIFREALHNVRKHAGARHVLVRLRQDEVCLRLLVDDDGRGFPFTGTFSQRALDEQGLGPVSIGERLRALGGTLSIDSSPDSGATLRMEIPLS